LLQEHTGLCHRNKIENVSRLEFEPSDVFADTDRGIMLVPSLMHIRSFPLPTLTASGDFISKGNSINVVSIAGADFEAVTSVADMVYAVSEITGSNESVVYAFIWDCDALDQVGKWTVPVTGAEGITYVPDMDSSGPGSLLIGDESGAVQYFDLPTVMGSNISAMFPKQSFNRKLLEYGLESGKVGALCFFEDVLYVLMDNSRVVRGWDLETGKLLSQWQLPQVGGTSIVTSQWEGMALLRVSREASEPKSGTRGYRTNSGGETELILILTLDTPAQIWSFLIKEGDKRGELILPECAATSWYNSNMTDFEAVTSFLNP
jgi:hypothetical protein